jgi:hypothetical protein
MAVENIVVVVEDNTTVIEVQPDPPQLIVSVNNGPKGDAGNGPLLAKDSRVTIEEVTGSQVIGITVPPIIAGTSSDPPSATGL